MIYQPVITGSGPEGGDFVGHAYLVRSELSEVLEIPYDGGSDIAHIVIRSSDYYSGDNDYQVWYAEISETWGAQRMNNHVSNDRELFAYEVGEETLTVTSLAEIPFFGIYDIMVITNV